MAGLRGMRALQKWAQVRTDGYKDVHVCDMSKSWRNGLAFCAIIHRYRPDLIDFDALSKENVYENNSLAFEVAQVELGVPALLDAEDMVALEVPDKLSITTYVAQLYNYFKDMIPVGGPDVKAPIKRHSAAPSSPLQSPKRITFDKKSKQQPSSDKKSSTLSDRCALCDGKVYLLERQIVDGHSYHRTCWKDSNPSPAAHGGYPLSPSHRQKKETPAFSFDVPHSKEHARSEPPKHTKIEKEKSTEDHKHKFRLHLGNHKKYDLSKDTTKTPVGKTKEISSHEEGLPSKFRKKEDKLADKSAKKGGLKTGEYGRKLLFKKDATPDVKSAISMFQDKEQETPGKAAATASPVLRRTENKGDNRKMDLGKSDSNKSDDFDLDSLVEANSEALSVSKTSANHKPRPVSLGVQKRTGPLGKAGNDKKDLTSPGKTMDLFISNVSRTSIRKEKAQSADLEHLKQTGVRHSFLDKLESTPRKNESDSPLKKTNVTPGYDSKSDSGDKGEKSKDIQERDIFKAYKEKYGTPTKETDVSKKQIPEVRKTDVVIPSKLHETPCKETKEETPADKAVSQSKDLNSVKKGLYGDRYFEEDWQLKLSAKIRGLSKGVKEESASEEKQEESMDQTASLHVDVTKEEEISESPSSSPTSQSSSEEKMEEQVETTTLNESRENFKPAPRSATHDNISEKSEKTELPPKASSLENLDKTPQKEKKYGVDDKHDQPKSSSVEDLLAARRRRRENLAASSVESLDSQGTPRASNMCAVCNDRVFRSERVQINGAVFHKKCQDKQPEVKSVPTEVTTKRTTDRTSRSSSESLNDIKEARNTEPNSVPGRKHSEKSLGSSAESLNDAKSVEKGAAIDTSSVIRRKKELNCEISQPDSEQTPTRATKSEIILTDQSNLKVSGVEFDGEFKKPFPKPRIKSTDNEKVNDTSNDKKVHEKTAYIPLKEKNSKDLEVKQERKYGWRNSKENTEYKVQDSPTFALKTNEKQSSWDEKEKQQKSRLGAKEDSNVPEWQLEAQKRQARKFVDPEKSWLTKTPEKFKQETVNSVSKTSNKTDVAKKWERDEKVDKGKPERSTLRQTQEEYPDELNPFGTTDDEKQLAKEIQAKNDNSSNIYNENNKAELSRRTKVKSYNPFESDEDDVPESPPKSSPVETKKKKGESLNPFETSDEDEDEDAGELSGWQKEAERRRIARESQSEEDWLRGRSVSSSDSETKGRGTRPVGNGVSETPPPKPPRSNAGTLEPESKLDWQKEAEKRQEARGGVYESPSRKVIHPKTDDNEDEEKHIAPTSHRLKKVVPDMPFHFDSTSTDRGRSSSTFSESEGVDSPRQQGGARKKRLAPQPPKDTPPLSPSPAPSPTPSPGIVSSPEIDLDLSNTHPRYKKRNAPSRPIAPKRKICSGERRLSTTEIKHELDVLDKEQTELEVEGRELENKIRGSGSQGEDDDELLSQWFELVNKKNRMVRRESEIIYISTTSTSDDEASNSHSGSLDGDSNAKIDSSNSSNNSDNKNDKKSDSSEEYATASDHKGSGSAASDDEDEEEDYLDDDDVFEEPVSNSRLQALEDRQADIEYDLRCIMEKQEHVKTDSDKQKEEELLAELVQVVEERSRVVDTMEEDRIRAEEEDKEIEVVLSEKGLNTGSPEKEKDKKKKEKKDKKGKKGKKK